MQYGCSERQIHRLLDDIYCAAVTPAQWGTALGSLSAVFHGSFADIFTRSHDRRYFHGLAHGLDRADYEDEFLGFWFKRNIWGNTKPVRIAGEVISTRDIVDVDELKRSEIYENYLAPRDLHEGLRLSLWVSEHDIQDISILRPWSAGAFGPSDVAFGNFILPHLQRAASVTRRLREMEVAMEAGVNALDASNLAVFLFDADGTAAALNPAADRVVTDGELLRLVQGKLQATTAGSTRDLDKALARASGRAGTFRQASVVSLVGPAARHANLMVLPVSGREDWAFARPSVAMALLREPSMSADTETTLSKLFGLTPAEADLAKQLLAGLHLDEVAAGSGRSLNTMRNHMAHLMSKTRTNKQGDLIRLLVEVAAFSGSAASTRAIRSKPTLR